MRRRGRSVLDPVLNKAGIERARFGFEIALLHHNNSGLQAGDAGAGGVGVRIAGGDDNASDAGLDQQIGAGWRAGGALRAGFERDVSRGAARSRASLRQRLFFSVGAAAIGGGGFADDRAIPRRSRSRQRDWPVRPHAGRPKPARGA